MRLLFSHRARRICSLAAGLQAITGTLYNLSWLRLHIDYNLMFEFVVEMR